MFCSNCGSVISEDAQVCEKCGNKILPPPDENKEEVLQGMGQADENTSKELYDDAINEEVQIINKHNKPLSTGGFFGTQILMMIPVVNIILMLIWSFRKGTNLNRRAYSRSMLIWFIILNVMLLFVILTLVFMGYPISIGILIKSLKSVVNGIPE